ncbi:hypothetical protein NDU88_003434 [Pleurodeles waltl]|uniref:Uncharacterized protein n=1 Tax=Pleurodeles waltl TaxID=8319 RepID=A0AAV7KYH0_PLEWA|nr:hypothetical protein NDU88_003434 [Pleurodeles waltl]
MHQGPVGGRLRRVASGGSNPDLAGSPPMSPTPTETSGFLHHEEDNASCVSLCFSCVVGRAPQLTPGERESVKEESMRLEMAPLISPLEKNLRSLEDKGLGFEDYLKFDREQQQVPDTETA